MSAVEFTTNKSYYSTIEWREAKNIGYPNITVCNSQFFDNTTMSCKRKLLAKVRT